MKKHIGTVLGLLVLVAMAAFVIIDHRNMPMVAYEGDRVVAVEHKGKVYPSFEAAGLSPHCRHIDATHTLAWAEYHGLVRN